MPPTEPRRPGRDVPPPSFTPQSGRPGRPVRPDRAIEIGDTGPQGAAPQHHPAYEQTVRPADVRGAAPSIAPRRPGSDQRRASDPPVRPSSVPPAVHPGKPVSFRTASGAPRDPAPGARPASVPPADRTSPAASPAGSRTPASVPPSHAPRAVPPRTADRAQSHAPARAGTPAGYARPPAQGRPSGGPGRPGGPGPVPPPPVGGRRRPSWRRIVVLGLCLALVALIAWPVGLLLWANGKIQHIDALSGASDTPGTTYLLAGSDSRADGAVGDDGTEGARTDTIMLLHVPDSGPTALISLPRDTYAEIPDNSANKLNTAYSWGGAPLLVQTVEQLSGLTVDHYVEVGFDGVQQIVDAAGGVELCLDYDVQDERSGLAWTAGCHTADGATALAFSRMRYSDPTGDIGRADRQRQLIGALTSSLQDSSILRSPGTQRALIDSGLAALHVDEDSGITDLGKLALAFRNANGPEGITGTPPISDTDYRPGNIGSTVRLDPDLAPQFWSDIAAGALPAGPVGGMPQ